MNSIKKERRSRTKGIITAGIVMFGCFATFEGVSYYKEWKREDRLAYIENSKQLSVCQNHFVAGRYREALECNKRLKIWLSDLGWFSSSKEVKEKADMLSRQIEDELLKLYTQRFDEVKNMFEDGKYSLAERLCKSLEKELEEADYFTGSRRMLAEVKNYSKNIEAAMEESEHDADLNKVYEKTKDLSGNMYRRLAGCYESIGMGKESETAAMLTMLLPVFLLLRKILKKR